MKTIEICVNDEWMGQLLDCMTDEVGSHYVNKVVPALEAAGFEAVLAKGQRTLYHGWNGARFTHKTGGLGTFDKLTNKELATVAEIDHAARDSYKA